MRPLQHHHAAFTLIEILASLMLFALGVTGVVAVISHGINVAVKVQAEASAWTTALSVLKDPLPQGAESDAQGTLQPWTWTHVGNDWIASDGSGAQVWRYASWPIDLASDVMVPDMANPLSNGASFPGGSPITGCAKGWLNGYYVERREQSRASDRIGDRTRMVEVRVDVYWASTGASDGRPLATAIDRIVRQGGP